MQTYLELMRTGIRVTGDARFWTFVDKIKVGNFLRNEPTVSVS